MSKFHRFAIYASRYVPLKVIIPIKLVTNRFFFNKVFRIQYGCQCYSTISAIKWCGIVKWSTIWKQLVLSKCHSKQFLNPVWVLMTNNNVDNEPLVIHDYQGHFIMSVPDSGKLWSHGCRIWWKIFFEIGMTNKFYWQIFLSVLYSEHNLFLTNVIVCVSFEDILWAEFSMSCFRMAQHHLFNFSASP